MGHYIDNAILYYTCEPPFALLEVGPSSSAGILWRLFRYTLPNVFVEGAFGRHNRFFQDGRITFGPNTWNVNKQLNKCKQKKVGTAETVGICICTKAQSPSYKFLYMTTHIYRAQLALVIIRAKKINFFLGLKGLSRTCIYRKYMIFMVKMSIKCLKIDWKMVW